MLSRLALRKKKAELSCDCTIQTQETSGSNPLGRGDGLEIGVHGAFWKYMEFYVTQNEK